jgi:hypothetical protein
MNNILSPYFFLVVFFAFFAGAFFVAMYFSPPFIRRQSIYLYTMHETGHSGSMVLQNTPAFMLIQGLQKALAFFLVAFFFAAFFLAAIICPPPFGIPRFLVQAALS